MLTNKLVLYIPSVACGVPIEEELWESAVKRSIELLCRVCGGATKTEAVGYWQSERDGLVEEAVTLVSAFFGGELADVEAGVKLFVAGLKSELKQESMALEVNGTLQFV